MITYTVTALPLETNSKKVEYHEKSFTNKDFAEARKQAFDYYFAIIEVLIEAQKFDVKLLERDFNLQTCLFTRELEFIDVPPKSKGLRVYVQHAEFKRRLEIDFLDIRNFKSFDDCLKNRKTELELFQRFNQNTEVLRIEEMQLRVRHFYQYNKPCILENSIKQWVGKLLEMQDLMRLEQIYSQNDFDNISPSVCAFLNSEKEGFIFFDLQECETENIGIHKHSVKLLKEILKIHFPNHHENIVYHEVEMYCTKLEAFKKHCVIEVKPKQSKLDVSFSQNNLSYKYIRNKTFGNVESLD